jgi:SecD/SecF fusion protein
VKKTPDESVTTELAEANPVPTAAAPGAEERAEAERLLRRVLDDPPPGSRHRPGSGVLATVVSVLVVLLVAGVVLRTGGSTTTASQRSHPMQITLRAGTPLTQRVGRTGISRTMAVLRARLASLVPGFAVRSVGADTIVVTVPERATGERARIVALLTHTGSLRVYDWEANVLTPNGRTVASQLPGQDPTALAVSQGAASGAGSAGPGTSSLYDAVRLATGQPRVPSSRLQSRVGPEYYMFGAPGSAACAAAGAAHRTATRPGAHCLLAGPLDAGSASRARVIAALAAQLPPGVNPSEGQVLVVPQGIVVVEAEPPPSAAGVTTLSPAARFFVMRDHVALTGSDITKPAAGTDESGAPDVVFRFTRAGRAAFQQATRTIAHRGANVSRAGLTLFQHFAVVLDNQLLTVPSISFRQYPDGIIAAGGADIVGGLSAPAARDLATQLRYGPLPVALRVVS